MKKTTYYNAELPEVELEIFINIKEEITFSMTDGTMPETTISLNKEEVEELIIDLQKLLKQI
jgi:hypothetical protein